MEIKVIVSPTRGNLVVEVIDGEIQHTKLEQGEILVELSNFNDFIKPQWKGSNWVEGATQEEIDAIINIPKVPTAEERITELEKEKLEKELVDLWDVVLFGGVV